MKLFIYTPPSKRVKWQPRGLEREVMLITKRSDGMCFVHRQWQRPEDSGPTGKWYHKRFWTHKRNLTLHPSRVAPPAYVAHQKPKPEGKKAKQKKETQTPDLSPSLKAVVKGLYQKVKAYHKEKKAHEEEKGLKGKPKTKKQITKKGKHRK